MKQIFEQESPPILAVFDDGQTIKAVLTQRPPEILTGQHTGPIEFVVTKKTRRVLLSLRLGLLLVLVLFGIWLMSLMDIADPMIRGLIGLATVVVFYKPIGSLLLLFWPLFHVKSYETVFEFDRVSQTVTPSTKGQLFETSPHGSMWFKPFKSPLRVHGDHSLPIDENAIFSAALEITYRYGLRQSNTGFVFMVDSPPIPRKAKAADWQRLGLVNLQERTAAVLNEVLVLVRESPVTKPEPEIKTEPATKRAKAKKPEPIIEDDAPFNPMD